jgi:hypothetical protein
MEDLVSRISDALRFVFAQHRDDIVVLVGNREVNDSLLSQLKAKPLSASWLPAQGAWSTTKTDIVSGGARYVDAEAMQQHQWATAAHGVNSNVLPVQRAHAQPPIS